MSERTPPRQRLPFVNSAAKYLAEPKSAPTTPARREITWATTRVATAIHRLTRSRAPAGPTLMLNSPQIDRSASGVFQATLRPSSGISVDETSPEMEQACTTEYASRSSARGSLRWRDDASRSGLAKNDTGAHALSRPIAIIRSREPTNEAQRLRPPGRTLPILDDHDLRTSARSTRSHSTPPVLRPPLRVEAVEGHQREAVVALARGCFGISEGDIQVSKRLGQGSFASVYLVVKGLDLSGAASTYALKVSADETRRDSLIQEARLLSNVDHVCIAAA